MLAELTEKPALESGLIRISGLFVSKCPPGSETAAPSSVAGREEDSKAS